MLLLVGGYLVFLMSGLFAIVAFWTLREVRAMVDLSAPVAVGLAQFFAGSAMLKFIGGFGGIGRGS